MTKPGFLYSDGNQRRRIYFIEDRGKDISYERWRATLYYEPNFAMTAFFDSAEAYESFLSKHRPLCFDDYETFRKEWKARGLRSKRRDG